MENIIGITINGKHEEIFMSYGLLNHLSIVVGEVNNITSIGLDPELREGVLKCLLSERTKTGKIKTERSAEDVDISLEDVENLIDWAAEHLVDFFLRRATKSKALFDKRMTELESLMSS